MEAKNLRIGNLLRYKNTNEFCVVELIHKKHFDCRDIKTLIFAPNCEYEPVTLTDELCKTVNSHNGIHNGKFSGLLTVKKDKHSDLYSLWIGTIFICYLQFYHELQNLFFALTGEELSYEISTKV